MRGSVPPAVDPTEGRLPACGLRVLGFRDRPWVSRRRRSSWEGSTGGGAGAAVSGNHLPNPIPRRVRRHSSHAQSPAPHTLAFQGACTSPRGSAMADAPYSVPGGAPVAFRFPLANGHLAAPREPPRPHHRPRRPRRPASAVRSGGALPGLTGHPWGPWGPTGRTGAPERVTPGRGAACGRTPVRAHCGTPPRTLRHTPARRRRRRAQDTTPGSERPEVANPGGRGAWIATRSGGPRTGSHGAVGRGASRLART